jgi:hypothetical protein
MSNFPIWWDTTLTVYNKFEDTQTQIVKWYRTVLKNCFWKATSDKVSFGNATLESNNIICRIPKDKRFLEKHEWINIPNDKMGNYFTLGRGDIIIRGNIKEEIDEYKSRKRSTDLIAKYKELQGCMEIDQITINTGAGRCNEHYYVKGI